MTLQCLLFVPFLMVLPHALGAQSTLGLSQKVILTCSCEDTVGKSYARALRDEVAKRARYDELADSTENRKRAVRLSIVSVPIDDDEAGQSKYAAFSVIFLNDGVMLEQYVQTCGVDVMERCVKGVLDNVDALLAKSQVAVTRPFRP